MSALHGLQASISEFEAAGTRIIAISPDSVADNKLVARRQGLEYPVLSDADLEVTKALGLLHVGASPSGGDIPRPAVFIIDKGVIQWRSLTDNWRVRVQPEPLLEQVKKTLGI